MTEEQKVQRLRKMIGVGTNVAQELLVLSGGDVDMAAQASLESRGLDQCKSAIIDKRFRKIEEVL